MWMDEFSMFTTEFENLRERHESCLKFKDDLYDFLLLKIISILFFIMNKIVYLMWKHNEKYLM